MSRVETRGWGQDLFPGFLLTDSVTPGQSVSLGLSLPDTLNLWVGLVP